MPTVVKIHKIYIARTIDVTVGFGSEEIPDADLRRFRRALADAVYKAFVAQGHRLEELGNFDKAWNDKQRRHTNIMRAEVELIGKIKHQEFERFSAAFLQALERSRLYTVEVVRGLKSLYK